MAVSYPTPAELRRTSLLVTAAVIGSNAVGAVLTFVYLTYLAPSPPRVEHLRHSSDAISLIAFVAFMLVVLPFGFARSRRQMAPLLAWIGRASEPTEAERDLVLGQAWTHSVHVFEYWLAAAAVFGGINWATLHNDVSVVARAVLGTLLGGLATSAVTFLMLERLLRPTTALALAGSAPPRHPKVGIRRRMLLAWALGSGIPFIGIVTAVLSRQGAPVQPGPILFLAAVGSVAGLLMVAFSAGAVADPLASVRSGLDRVEAGKLDIEIPVDDAGEVGLVQAGFNSMVQGLRERRRLEDLFGRHVGTEVARQAVERGLGLGGEQRQVSALFVDLIGSTRLAATRPASEVVNVLNAMFGAVQRAVDEEGGWVNKFEGDGALCLFGAPVEQPDHSARALRAARNLRTELARLGRSLHGLDAAIGVSSGIAVAGNVGSEQRYEYTVIGDAVNEAARLCDAAKERPSRLLASSASVRGAGEEAAAWSELGPVQVRGRDEPALAWEPTGYGAEARALAARSTPSSSTS